MKFAGLAYLKRIDVLSYLIHSFKTLFKLPSKISRDQRDHVHSIFVRRFLPYIIGELVKQFTKSKHDRLVRYKIDYIRFQIFRRDFHRR